MEFLENLKQYDAAERSYVSMYPDAQPLGQFYHFFGMKRFLQIIEESNGRQILFNYDDSRRRYTYQFIEE